jgi:hypothetical protein
MLVYLIDMKIRISGIFLYYNNVIYEIWEGI